jgi:chromosomal replication initiator protein
MNEPQYISVWSECLKMIRDVIPPTSFKTWFEPLKAVKLEEKTLTLEVPSDFVREYLEEHYINYISRALKREIGSDAKLMYKVRVVKNDTVTLPHQDSQQITNKSVPYPQNGSGINNPFIIPGLKQLNINPQLNPSYSFTNFVEGECNRLARAAGLSIAENPGSNAFNPLLIYGGPGLGKTHLAQAIGIAIKEKYPDKIVLYISANRFQTQYMDAVNVKNKLTDFLHFYMMMDVLIIDDVHEFAEKPGTQNAFFQIFNHLHQSGKQLILTSDRAPVELKGLEKRLLSRFKWGLSAELFPPTFDTRMAILKEKSFKDGINLPEEILTFLAEKIIGNIREIEGTLISLIAHATLNKEKITLELAQRLTEKIVDVDKTEISIKKIQMTVCDYFGLSQDSLGSKTRKREIVQARQIAMYLGRNLTKTSLSSIGTQIGGKDHATVLHACNTVQDLIDTDKNFKQYVTDIKKQLKCSL